MVFEAEKETKKSFSQLTGITRTTIYNILDGKVNRIQNQTVERIANFSEQVVMLLKKNL